MRHRPILWMCLLISGLVLLLDRASPLLSRLELLTLDWRFVRRGPRKPGPDVVLVTIDEKSLKELGDWPWPYTRHAALVELLQRCGAAAVVFDVSFSATGGQRQDDAFAAAVRRAGNVLLPAGYLGNGMMGRGGSAAQDTVALSLDRVVAADALVKKSPSTPRPPPRWMPATTKELFWMLPIPALLSAARGVGYVDIHVDADAVCRRVAPVTPVDDTALYAHLGVLAAALKLGLAPREIHADDAHAVHLGNLRTIPVSEHGTILIDFAGPPPSARRAPMFPRYSYSDVLRLASEARPHPLTPSPNPGRGGNPSVLPSPRIGRGAGGEGGRVSPETFRGKLVFVGATAARLNDQRPSPYSRENDGVETNANVANCVLENRFFSEPGAWVLILLTLGAGVLLSQLLALRSMRLSVLLTLLAGLLYVLAVLLFFSGPRIVLPMAAPLAVLALSCPTVIAYRFQTEYKERLRGLAYLDLYVTRPVAQRILADPNASALGGQRVEISVLFADILGFTAAAAALKPEEVVTLLNDYCERMAPAILDQDGMLVQYVGDEIMGLWGAPIEQPDHARRAVLAGLGMLAQLEGLQGSWRQRGLPPFELRIGINSGRAVAGNMGCTKRAQYTAVGDTVNTAARLKTLTEELGAQMLLSEETWSFVQDLVEAQAKPPTLVKGKTQPLVAYEVLGLKGSGVQAIAESVER